VLATVKIDRPGHNEVGLLENVIPLVVGLVGLAALVVGIVLARTRRDDGQPEHADAAAPEPILDPAP
jgi:hypothetical protein